MADHWISMDEAHEALVRQKPDWGALEQLEDHASAWRVLVCEMIEGRLRSRPADPASYSLSFRSPGGDEKETIPLERDDSLPKRPMLLPRTFWHRFDEADELEKEDATSRNEARSFHENYYFTRQFSDGTMTGHVGKVLVWRSDLARLLPRTSGRPLGKGDFVQIDAQTIDRTIVSWRKGTWKSYDQALRHHMKGVREYVDDPSRHLGRLRGKFRTRRNELGIN